MMNRFFINAEQIDDVVEIRGDDFNHISNSLRLKKGDKIIISDQKGYDYIVRLDEFTDISVKAIVVNKKKNNSEPKIKIDLGQAIPKNRNMEYVIQKCVEIGAHKIIPINTKRTIVKLSHKKEQKRLKRWQKISEEAAKQSQRGIIPVIKNIVSTDDKNNFKKLFAGYDLILLLYTDLSSSNFKDILRDYEHDQISNMLLLIGPEGGFTKKEVKFFEEIKRQTYLEKISLGNRILRTETAGLVALSVVLYEYDELGGE